MSDDSVFHESTSIQNKSKGKDINMVSKFCKCFDKPIGKPTSLL
jgi:hypothetical protein